ncbi:MAG: glycoside hydrolase family 127 protein [Clostridia bacterium]|nr:glycoside hydrolase family 127 protein [Clostridia bacterium]
MPQPIVFQRAPLVQAKALPLNPGQVLPAGELPAALLALVPENVPLRCLEGAVRVSALTDSADAVGRIGAALQAQLDTQREDGSFPLAFADALAVARAAWFRAMADGSRTLFAAVNRWLGWAGAHYEEIAAELAVRHAPADLAELLVMNYRQLGSQGALRLLARIRRDADDWATRLGAFAVDRPADGEQLRQKLLEAPEEERTYWEDQAAISDPVRLAEGFRAVHAFSLYSGNRSEAEAGGKAWTRLQRWHGAVCGGVTGADCLGGRSPAAAIDPAAVGAWLEALAPYAADGEAWAAEGIEQILCSALPAVLRRGAFAVNQTDGKTTPVDARALGHLARGYAAAALAAVAAEPDGCAVRYLMPGVCGLRVRDQRFRLKIGRTADGMVLTVHPDSPAPMCLTLRVPAWLTGPAAALNGAVCAVPVNGECVLDQTWHDGDRVTLTGKPALRITEGHHQSRAVFLGAALMALPVKADEPFAYALASAGTDEDGRVVASLIPVNGWRLRDGLPADVPVLPAAAGDAVERELIPFACLDSGIAVFAGVRAS